jgi:nucleotide-binding universal stress UspA family protein
MSQRVLLGYDGRSEASDALSLAVILAEALNATLVVAKVCPEIAPLGHFASYEEALGQASAGVLGDAERLLRRQSPIWRSRNEPSAARVPPRASGISRWLKRRH